MIIVLVLSIDVLFVVSVRSKNDFQVSDLSSQVSTVNPVNFRALTHSFRFTIVGS